MAESAFEIMLRECKSKVMAESAFEIMLRECKSKGPPNSASWKKRPS